MSEPRFLRRRPVRRALLAGLCAAALTVGACSRADKSVVEEITVDAASLDLSGADARALERHFTVAPRRGSEADTLAVLDALGLGGRTDGRSIDGSTATYADWQATQGSSTVEAERVVLSGLHMDDGEPRYDALQADGVSVLDVQGQDRVEARLASLVVVEPDAAFAADLVNVLSAVEQPDETTAAITGQDAPFRGLRVSDMRANVFQNVFGPDAPPDTAQTGTLSLNQVVIGNDRDAGTVDMIVDTVDFDWGAGTAGQGERTRLVMDGMTALGVRMDVDAAGMARGGPMGVLGALTPGAEPPYREVDVGVMRVSSRVVDVDVSGFEADSERAGDTLTLRSVLQPATLTLKDAADTPLAPFYDTLVENGLAEFSLKGSQTAVFNARADRVEVSEARFEIDEGLRLDCDYALEGMAEAARALEDSGVAPPDLDAVTPDTNFEDLVASMQAYEAARTEAQGRVRIAALDCSVQDVADNSFVTRAYAVASDVSGMPVPVLKGQAKTAIAISSLTARDPFQRDLMDTLGSGLIEFLDTPGQTLRVVVAPDAPVALSTLRGENAMLAPLNLSVTVE